MKRFYQFFAMMFVALAVVACGDNKADITADLRALDAVSEQNSNLAEVQQLQADLMSATTGEEQAVIFNKIADKYKAIKDSVSALSVKTPEGKGLQDKFISAFDDFIKLMNDSATYVVTPPTAEQQQALMILQQQAGQKLMEAAQGIEELKAKIEKK